MTGTIIQGLIFVGNENYSATAWQGTLLVIANVLVVWIVNVWGAKWIAAVQNALLGFHLLVFLAVVIPLWAVAPHQSASVVFTQFAKEGGWDSMALTLMIGQISAIWGCIGSDAPAHMAEEVKDAGRSVPQAMFWSYVVNGILGIILVVTICFAIPNLDDSLNDATGYPFLYAFRMAMSDAATTAISVGVLVLIFASNVSYLASTARETFAFARDRGLPFSKILGAVS